MLRSRRALLQKSQQIFPADPQWLAGEKGETLTAECIRQSLQQRRGQARLYPSLRVPRRDGQGKWEIDFVLLTEQVVLVIEVKHWSGRIARRGSQWIQESAPCQKAFDDPLPLLQKKAEALIHWLSQRGCSLSPTSVRSLVVLTHPELQLQGMLGQESMILPIAQVPLYLQNLLLSSSARQSPLDFSALKAQLKRLPTWDEIRFYGGRIWRGDLHSLLLKTPHGTQYLTRERFAAAQISCPRTFWQSLWQRPRISLTDWTGMRDRGLAFGEGSQLVFQTAGQSQREPISLLHLERIDLGSRNQDYYKTLLSPEQAPRRS